MKIVVIAPYQKLKQIADTVIKENNFIIECYIGNLEQGLQIARELEAAEPCIFISRGGTAKLIRENLFSQVININISSYDLLEIFTPYINRKDVRIGIVGFNSLLEPARSVCSALGIQAQFFQIHDENEVFQKIDEIQNQHINLIVGDVISVRIAQKYNLNYHLIESSGDSVKDAIEKAMALMDNIQSEMEKLGKIRAIIDSVKDGVLFVDRELKIEQFNMKAREFLLGRFPKDEILKGRSILDFVEKSDLPDVLASKNKSYGKLFHINKNPYVFYSTPILVDGRSEGVVSVFQPVEELQKIESKVRTQLHKKGLTAKYRFQDIISHTPAMLHVIKHAKQYAGTLSNILITGETGTGKELLAQSIHNASPVKGGPFVAVNCSALSASLLESELFGYVGGAFTGALKGGKTGLFELAHKGTIFLDEINSMDIQLQARLLRVLQEQEIMRLGDEKVIPISVRVICASNSDLMEEVQKGNLRKDLFYRLSVLEIDIPALQKRQDDIIPLFRYFVSTISGRGKHSEPPFNISKEFENALLGYSWPGNVRELENLAEKYMTLIQIEPRAAVEELLSRRLENSDESCDQQDLRGSLKDIEKRIIDRVFAEEGENISRTAVRLQIDRNTLKRKLADSYS